MVYTDGKMLPLPSLVICLGRKMITVTAGTSDPLIFTAKLHGAAVYLDNFAIKALAKGDPARRRRFVDSIHNGAELVFSGYIKHDRGLAGQRTTHSTSSKDF